MRAKHLLVAIIRLIENGSVAGSDEIFFKNRLPRYLKTVIEEIALLAGENEKLRRRVRKLEKDIMGLEESAMIGEMILPESNILSFFEEGTGT